MFDQTSGQVFKEWTVPRQAISDQADIKSVDWSRRRPYPKLKARGGRGPRSLVDMAINVVADNIGQVAVGHLDGIPNRLLWRVWRFLEARGACLHAWRMLSKLLLDEGDDTKTLALYRFRQHICHPGDELKRYTQPLTSPSIDFVTHLVITGGCTFTTNNLLCLTDIPNLGVLELIQPADELRAVFPEVSNRLLRGWTEKPDPFPLLRVLRIWGDQTTTQDSLQWVTKFPALALYDVMGFREDWKSPDEIALKYGWERADSSFGLEDSLLRYLMLFVSPEETGINRMRELSRSIDSDLVALCSDSGCVVKFVADRQAPPLRDYLTDNAKVYMPAWNPDVANRDARACQGIAFEPWAFWLYSFIGQLSADRDLANRGVRPNNQAVVGPFVLPSKPLACLHLGHSARGGISTNPSYVSRGLFATRQYTFTRASVAHGADILKPETAPKAESSKATTLSQKTPRLSRKLKRRRLDDILGSFSG